MSLTKKSDVKNHLSARWRAGSRSHLTASQPNAAGFSGSEPGAVKADPSGFVEDFHGEHSSHGITMEPVAHLTSSVDIQVPAAPGNPQK